MTTLREAAQQALEALEATHYDVGSAEKQRLQVMDAITALRAALAQKEHEPTVRYKCTVVDAQHPNGVPFEQWVNAPQEEPEPVAPYAWMAVGGTIWRRKTSEDDVPLYTHPPRREWQGLSEEEIRRMGIETPGQQGGWNLAFARAVESALKEKNA
jgi:hypothetical protein